MFLPNNSKLYIIPNIVFVLIFGSSIITSRENFVVLRSELGGILNEDYDCFYFFDTCNAAQQWSFSRFALPKTRIIARFEK